MTGKEGCRLAKWKERGQALTTFTYMTFSIFNYSVSDGKVGLSFGKMKGKGSSSYNIYLYDIFNLQ